MDRGTSMRTSNELGSYHTHMGYIWSMSIASWEGRVKRAASTKSRNLFDRGSLMWYHRIQVDR